MQQATKKSECHNVMEVPKGKGQDTQHAACNTRHETDRQAMHRQHATQPAINICFANCKNEVGSLTKMNLQSPCLCRDANANARDNTRNAQHATRKHAKTPKGHRHTVACVWMSHVACARATCVSCDINATTLHVSSLLSKWTSRRRLMCFLN